MVTAAALVLAASLGEAVLALRSWAACDVGINAAANSLSMVYLGLPLLLTCNAVVAAVTLWVTGHATRSSPRRRLWMRVTPALALAVVAYIVWAVVITDATYPDPICPDNIPPWVPSWVPPDRSEPKRRTRLGCRGSRGRDLPLLTRVGRSCRGAVVPVGGSAAIASDVAPTPVLIDPGPIPYRRIELFGDPDLEHGLRHMGLEPEETAYKLLEIPIEDIGETRSMASWTGTTRLVIEAMKQGHEFPPIVVFRTAVGWNLIDGVNRSYAAWHLGLTTIRAYELIQIPQ